MDRFVYMIKEQHAPSNKPQAGRKRCRCSGLAYLSVVSSCACQPGGGGVGRWRSFFTSGDCTAMFLHNIIFLQICNSEQKGKIIKFSTLFRTEKQICLNGMDLMLIYKSSVPCSSFPNLPDCLIYKQRNLCCLPWKRWRQGKQNLTPSVP